MNLQAKRQELLTSLEQIRGRIAQLGQELAQRQAQEQQIVGAIMLCEELMQPEAEVTPTPAPVAVG